MPKNVETTSLCVTNNRREILWRAATDKRVSRFLPGQARPGVLRSAGNAKTNDQSAEKMNVIFADADRPFMVLEFNQPNVS